MKDKIKRFIGFFTGILWHNAYYLGIHLFVWCGGQMHRTPDAYYYAYGEKVLGILPNENTFNFNVCGYITLLSLLGLIKIKAKELRVLE